MILIERSIVHIIKTNSIKQIKSYNIFYNLFLNLEASIFKNFVSTPSLLFIYIYTALKTAERTTKHNNHICQVHFLEKSVTMVCEHFLLSIDRIKYRFKNE